MFFKSLSWKFGLIPAAGIALLIACGPAAAPTAAPVGQQSDGGLGIEIGSTPTMPSEPTTPVEVVQEDETPTAQPTRRPNTAPKRPTLTADDPEIREQLREARIRPYGWKTDFTKRSVEFSEITSGGPSRDGIPPIDKPAFVLADDADLWLEPKEPVIALEIDGDARAYPLQIMMWHEIVNDEVGGIPVSVTFCPLCNSSITFDRRLGGKTYDFGTSGNLRNSDLIMWDRQTETWWQQLTGEAIVGELTGQRLTFLPSAVISWEDFKTSYPNGQVLSRDTGFVRSYGQNPYVGYDDVDLPPFLFFGDLDGRLLPKERVAAVNIGDVDAAFPFSVLNEERVVNYTIADQDLVVFFKPGTRSALDHVLIGASREVGATGVFVPFVDDLKLTFRAEGDLFFDNETNSQWDFLGMAIDGPMTGTQLTPIVHANHLWFAWAAFKPDTLIYQGAEG